MENQIKTKEEILKMTPSEMLDEAIEYAEKNSDSNQANDMVDSNGQTIDINFD